jgi:hypothetical protein
VRLRHEARRPALIDFLPLPFGVHVENSLGFGDLIEQEDGPDRRVGTLDGKLGNGRAATNVDESVGERLREARAMVFATGDWCLLHDLEPPCDDEGDRWSVDLERALGAPVLAWYYHGTLEVEWHRGPG